MIKGSKEKIIIFGNTKHSHMLREIIEMENVAEVVAYTVDYDYITGSKVVQNNKKYPLVAFEQLEEIYPPTEYKILNTIGYTKMNNIRHKKSAEVIAKGYELYSFISENAIVLSNISEGVGNVVMPGSYVGTNIEIGNNNVIYSGSTLTHDITIKNNTFIGAGCVIGGNVKIGNNCFLGLNSTIRNEVELANYTLVGASTYISKATDENAVYVPERSKKLEKDSFYFL